MAAPPLSLRPLQQQGLEHLRSHPRANLFMVPGAGKTGIALTNMVDLVAFPAMVIAPLKVCQLVWRQEAELWFPGMNVQVLIGAPRQRLRALSRSAEIYVINPEGLPWLEEQTYPNWRCVTVDECTMLRGLRLSQGTRNARLLMKHASKSAHYFGMTGTPVPNGLGSLWGVTYPVDRGERLGHSFDDFDMRWFTTIPPFNQKVALGHAFDEITAKIRDISPSLEAPFKVDEPIEHIVPVPMPDDIRRLYEEMESTMSLEDLKIEALNDSTKASKLAQLSAGGIINAEGEYTILSEHKMDALERLAGEHVDSLLVVYRFRFEREMILKRFKGMCEPISESSVARFKQGRLRMLTLHAKAGGHGLSLQDNCATVVHTTLQPDFELHDQVNARVGPMRQKQSGFNRPVHHFYLISSKVDEIRLKSLQTKESFADLFMRAMTLR
jgi:hypothetical protein